MQKLLQSIILRKEYESITQEKNEVHPILIEICI